MPSNSKKIARLKKIKPKIDWNDTYTSPPLAGVFIKTKLAYHKEALMKLNVKIRNFGKVHEANITIRPFTVITGCNSSGKSFITRGLYSILHTLNHHSNLFKWTEVYTQSLGNEIRRAFCENFQITNTTNLISGEHSQFALNEETFVQILPSGEINFSIHPSLLNETQSLKNVVYLESPVYFKMRNALKDFKITQFNLVRRGAISPIPKYFYDLDNLLSANLPDVSHKFAQIAAKIEQIIHGNLAITPRGDIVYQEQNKNPVSLNMASSGISNLGMIALLLRHNILDEGSFLFIDEPEINLHTTWQHLMLDILLDLSHAGVNVVVATHSLDMLHRLEHIVSPMTDEEASMQISINRLTLNGETEPYSGSVLGEIYAAKQVLGEPYIKLLHERLP